MLQDTDGKDEVKRMTVFSQYARGCVNSFSEANIVNRSLIEAASISDNEGKMFVAIMNQGSGVGNGMNDGTDSLREVIKGHNSMLGADDGSCLGDLQHMANK